MTAKPASLQEALGLEDMMTGRSLSRLIRKPMSGSFHYRPERDCRSTCTTTPQRGRFRGLAGKALMVARTIAGFRQMGGDASGVGREVNPSAEPSTRVDADIPVPDRSRRIDPSWIRQERRPENSRHISSGKRDRERALYTAYPITLAQRWHFRVTFNGISRREGEILITRVICSGR